MGTGRAFSKGKLKHSACPRKQRFSFSFWSVVNHSEFFSPGKLEPQILNAKQQRALNLKGLPHFLLGLAKPGLCCQHLTQHSLRSSSHRIPHQALNTQRLSHPNFHNPSPNNMIKSVRKITLLYWYQLLPQFRLALV